jgi:hypothetical protein
MKLPNVHKAIVDISKLRDYCLSNIHPTGKHKAVVFESSIGITTNEAESFKSFILAEIKNYDAIELFEDKFGKRFYVDIIYRTIAKDNTIRTSWIIKTHEEAPRLTSCYI